MKRLGLILLLVSAILTATAASANSSAAPVTIKYRKSACVQRPNVDTGQVRFFVHFYNSSPRRAKFQKTIRFLWLRAFDGWKDSWLNSVAGNTIVVPARRGKTYYADFGADPSKLIIRCALRIGASLRLHHVRVIR